MATVAAVVLEAATQKAGEEKEQEEQEEKEEKDEKADQEEQEEQEAQEEAAAVAEEKAEARLLGTTALRTP